MSTTTRPATIRLLAAVASLLLVSALIVRTTDAAFSDTTTNTGNSFTAGSVSISGAEGDPLFWLDPDGTFSVDASRLTPGDVRTSSCLVLTYGGDVTADVSLASVGTFTGGDLSDYLDVTVERFDNSDCSGSAAASTTVELGALAGGWDTGWSPNASGDQQAFRFAVEVQDVDAASGQSIADVDFVWEAATP